MTGTGVSPLFLTCSAATAAAECTNPAGGASSTSSVVVAALDVSQPQLTLFNLQSVDGQTAFTTCARRCAKRTIFLEDAVLDPRRELTQRESQELLRPGSRIDVLLVAAVEGAGAGWEATRFVVCLRDAEKATFGGLCWMSLLPRTKGSVQEQLQKNRKLRQAVVIRDRSTVVQVRANGCARVPMAINPRSWCATAPDDATFSAILRVPLFLRRPEAQGMRGRPDLTELMGRAQLASLAVFRARTFPRSAAPPSSSAEGVVSRSGLGAAGAAGSGLAAAIGSAAGMVTSGCSAGGDADQLLRALDAAKPSGTMVLSPTAVLRFLATVDRQDTQLARQLEALLFAVAPLVLSTFPVRAATLSSSNWSLQGFGDVDTSTLFVMLPELGPDSMDRLSAAVGSVELDERMQAVVQAVSLPANAGKGGLGYRSPIVLETPHYAPAAGAFSSKRRWLWIRVISSRSSPLIKLHVGFKLGQPISRRAERLRLVNELRPHVLESLRQAALLSCVAGSSASLQRKQADGISGAFGAFDRRRSAVVVELSPLMVLHFGSVLQRLVANKFPFGGAGLWLAVQTYDNKRCPGGTVPLQHDLSAFSKQMHHLAVASPAGRAPAYLLHGVRALYKKGEVAYSAACHNFGLQVSALVRGQLPGVQLHAPGGSEADVTAQPPAATGRAAGVASAAVAATPVAAIEIPPPSTAAQAATIDISQWRSAELSVDVPSAVSRTSSMLSFFPTAGSTEAAGFLVELPADTARRLVVEAGCPGAPTLFPSNLLAYNSTVHNVAAPLTELGDVREASLRAGDGRNGSAAAAAAFRDIVSLATNTAACLQRATTAPTTHVECTVAYGPALLSLPGVGSATNARKACAEYASEDPFAVSHEAVAASVYDLLALVRHNLLLHRSSPTDLAVLSLQSCIHRIELLQRQLVRARAELTRHGQQDTVEGRVSLDVMDLQGAIRAECDMLSQLMTPRHVAPPHLRDGYLFAALTSRVGCAVPADLFALCFPPSQGLLPAGSLQQFADVAQGMGAHTAVATLLAQAVPWDSIPAECAVTLNTAPWVKALRRGRIAQLAWGTACGLGALRHSPHPSGLPAAVRQELEDDDARALPPVFRQGGDATDDADGFGEDFGLDLDELDASELVAPGAALQTDVSSADDMAPEWATGESGDSSGEATPRANASGSAVGCKRPRAVLVTEDSDSDGRSTPCSDGDSDCSGTAGADDRDCDSECDVSSDDASDSSDAALSAASSADFGTTSAGSPAHRSRKRLAVAADTRLSAQLGITDAAIQKRLAQCLAAAQAQAAATWLRMGLSDPDTCNRLADSLLGPASEFTPNGLHPRRDRSSVFSGRQDHTALLCCLWCVPLLCVHCSRVRNHVPSLPRHRPSHGLGR